MFSRQVKFARDLGFSGDESSWLLIYQGFSSFVARILSGRLCDLKWINPCYLYQLSIILDGTSVAFASLASHYSHLVTYSVFFGIAEGGFVATFSIILLNSVEPSRRASAFGLGAMSYGMGIALGGPTAGRDFDISSCLCTNVIIVTLF